MNRVLFGLLLGAALVSGAWFGEDLSAFAISTLGISTYIFLAGLCFILLRPVRLHFRLLLGGIFVAVFFGGVLIGRLEAHLAYNDCIARGEHLRLALRDFREQHGTFPASLSDVGVSLPGQRLLRGTLLSYTRTADGYLLSFSDRYVVHNASETEHFLARK